MIIFGYYIHFWVRENYFCTSDHFNSPYAYMLTGTPGSSARDAGDRVVEIVTDKLMLDELLDADLLRLPNYPRDW